MEEEGSCRGEGRQHSHVSVHTCVYTQAEITFSARPEIDAGPQLVYQYLGSDFEFEKFLLCP